MFFCIFFLIIEIDFFNLAVITKIFNPNAELVIPTETSTKEAKAETQTQPVNVEAKISECLL